MSLTGSAVVAIWNDIVPASREGFFEWHPREHMNERLEIPGFRRGRRYVALEAGIEFFTLYEADDTSVLTGSSYKKRLGSPTPWSLEVLPGFRNNLRGVCDVVASAGYADGGILATIRFAPREGSESALKAALTERVTALLAEPRITGVHLAICDLALSGTNTALQRGRTITPPAWVLLIEGSALDGVGAVTTRLCGGGGLVELGATPAPVSGLYRMEYQVSRLTVDALPD